MAVPDGILHHELHEVIVNGTVIMIPDVVKAAPPRCVSFPATGSHREGATVNCVATRCYKPNESTCRITFFGTG